MESLSDGSIILLLDYSNNPKFLVEFNGSRLRTNTVEFKSQENKFVHYF